MRIQLSTRRNILDSFLVTRLHWAGRLEQNEFLGRLYDLNKLPSTDHRYKTASEDIYKHTVLNDDWPEQWVFTDSRFDILYQTDERFLKFLCMTLHPTTQRTEEEINILIPIYNNNLTRDGFNIEADGDIAGKLLFVGLPIEQTKANRHLRVDGTPPLIKKCLVVGCSSYEHAGVLSNAVNDARGMESVLTTLGFEVLVCIDPTQRELKIAIDEFGKQLQGTDVGLFYFAGHGVQVRGLNYLIPVDANLVSEQIVEYDCVEAGRVLAHMEDAKTTVNILILDACRNNPFERSWSRGIGQRGLATMYAPKGSLVAYATAPGRTASDGIGSNGLYTRALNGGFLLLELTMLSVWSYHYLGQVYPALLKFPINQGSNS